MSKEKLLKADFQGTIEINGINISCAVLQDGTRVISERSLATALGIRGGGAYWEKRKAMGSDQVLPEYISVNNIEPFVSKALKERLSESISYIPKTGKTRGGSATGFRAEILPEICDVWIKADEAKALTASQKNVAKTAYIILKGFATVGIIALVDEATGYQYEREKDELQKIFKAYISEELLPWQKRFPDIFYKEVFRLNGWEYTVQSIKKRPSVVGTWTNNLIYNQLPKGVLEELKSKTPKSRTGNYTARFHQSLTEDIGEPHLQAQINSVIALMQISDNWKQLLSNFNKMVDRRKGQLELKFEDLEPKEEPVKTEKTIDNPSTFDKSLQGLLSVKPERDN